LTKTKGVDFKVCERTHFMNLFKRQILSTLLIGSCFSSVLADKPNQENMLSRVQHWHTDITKKLNYWTPFDSEKADLLKTLRTQIYELTGLLLAHDKASSQEKAQLAKQIENLQNEILKQSNDDLKDICPIPGHFTRYRGHYIFGALIAYGIYQYYTACSQSPTPTPFLKFEPLKEPEDLKIEKLGPVVLAKPTYTPEFLKEFTQPQITRIGQEIVNPIADNTLEPVAAHYNKMKKNAVECLNKNAASFVDKVNEQISPINGIINFMKNAKIYACVGIAGIGGYSFCKYHTKNNVIKPIQKIIAELHTLLNALAHGKATHQNIGALHLLKKQCQAQALGGYFNNIIALFAEQTRNELSDLYREIEQLDSAQMNYQQQFECVKNFYNKYAFLRN
jgi:hypothetical protein